MTPTTATTTANSAPLPLLLLISPTRYYSILLLLLTTATTHHYFSLLLTATFFHYYFYCYYYCYCSLPLLTIASTTTSITTTTHYFPIYSSQLASSPDPIRNMSVPVIRSDTTPPSWCFFVGFCLLTFWAVLCPPWQLSGPQGLLTCPPHGIGRSYDKAAPAEVWLKKNEKK